MGDVWELIQDESADTGIPSSSSPDDLVAEGNRRLNAPAPFEMNDVMGGVVDEANVYQRCLSGLHAPINPTKQRLLCAALKATKMPQREAKPKAKGKAKAKAKAKASAKAHAKGKAKAKAKTKPQKQTAYAAAKKAFVERQGKGKARSEVEKLWRESADRELALRGMSLAERKRRKFE